MKTFSLKARDIKRSWHIVDATNMRLGRLAAKIAPILRGKHKAEYTPHLDNGDYIVVINVDKMTVTGNKLDQKVYNRYTGYVGNLKTERLADMMRDKPDEALRKAVVGMLPKGPLGRQMVKKLKIVIGADHPHVAQNLKVLEL